MKQKIHYLFMLLLMLLTGVGGVKAEVYTLTISGSDFNAKSYADNNNTKTSTAKSTSEKTYDVKWTSNQVMLNSNAMQWQKNSGCIYNNTDLGTIKSVTVTSSEGSFTTYYGSSIQPNSITDVGGGFFQIKVGSATGKSSEVKIVFEIVESGVAVDPNVRFEKDNIEAYIGQSLTNALDKPNNLTVNYSSSDENVAIVDNNGQVSCRGEGKTEISAEWDAVEGVYNSGVVKYNLRVKDPQNFKTFTFTPTEQTAGTLENAPTGVTAEFNNTYPDKEQLTSGKEMTLTIKGIPSTYNVTGIFLNVRNNKSSGKGVAVATLGSSELGTMAIEGLGNVYSEQKMSIDPSLATGDLVIKISCSQNSVFCNRFNIEYELPEGFEVIATPTFSVPAGTYFEAQTVNLTCETDGAAIYYTLDGTEPTAGSTEYKGAIAINETTTLKAIAIKGEDASAVATAEYKIVDTTGKGTEEKPFTVADAIKVLDAGITPTNVYVAGTVSKVKGYYNSKYISYTITDGDNELDVYNGLNNGGEAFNSESDIQVRDQVIVKGDLIDYNGTKEFAANNQLVSLVRPEKPDPDLAFSAEAVLVKRGEAFTAPVLANPHNLIVEYESSNEAVATVAEDGSLTLLKAGETTITASFAGNADYKAGEASYTLTVTVPSHFATFFVNGQQQGEPVTVAEDETITFPTVAEELYGKKFVGWTTEAIDGETNDEPATLVNAATMGTADVTYYAVYAVREGEGVSSVTTLTNADIVAAGEGKTGYNFWTITDSNDRKWNAHAVKNQHSNATSGYHYLQIKKSTDSEQFYIQVPEMGGTITAMTMTVSGSSQPMTDGNNSSTLFFSNSNLTSATGNGVVSGEGASTVTLDCSSLGLSTGYITSSGAVRIWDVKVTYGTPASYSDYCTTVVAPVKPAKPIVFHDGGEYEDALTVAIAGEGTIKYTLNGDAEQTYTAPFTISKTTTVKAWTEQDGVKSDVVEKTFTIVEKAKGAVVEDGYYTIKNNGNGKYVNVAGRKTVTFVDEAATASAAGTVIKVKADADGVKVLRSQGVDIPGYADKAMRYVPEIVKLVVNKLNNLGEGQLMGEAGLEALMKKFNEAFDEHLYLEQAGENSYRIYGRTPSMKHVVDFYAENKANVDAKLPMLEGKINAAIDKVLEKTNGRGKSILVDFCLHEIWEKMGGNLTKLTEPVDETSTARFYEEVLSSETNVWNFAYQTAMIYWGNLKNNDTFKNYINKLGDYAKYIDKVENIRPNFKYYIVQKDNKLDIISEGNGELNADFTAWTLIPRTDFSVAFNEENVLNDKYYTTLYTDFAYTLPTGVKAYKVTEVSEAGVAVKVEMEGIIPAQTPVLLESESKENQTLILSTVDGTAPTDNLLVGADALINQYPIKTAQVESLFNLAKDILGESFYNTYIQKYEHLMARNAGTVNNKYFFGLTKDDLKLCYYLNDNEEKDCVVRSLSMGDEKLGFYDNWTAKANEAFLVSEKFNTVKLTLKGDVNRDGSITIADVTALVNIILGKATYPADADKYDFEAAHVNADEEITIADVTALVNIILGKTQN